MMNSAAGDGAQRIAWAARSMPVLAHVAQQLSSERTLAGRTVAVNLVLEPKTANLVGALAAAGAQVVVGCGASSTDEAVAQALRDQGFVVHASREADESAEVELQRQVLGHRPDIIVDDGSTLIRLAHREFPDLLAGMLGVTEETTSGVRPLRVMQREGALQVPVIAVNDMRTKYLFDNIYGTGQSCVTTLLDLTNLQLAGREVAVIGYGWVGMGVAKYAAALGGRITVAEVDPVKALRALHEGYRVAALGDVAERTEVVFACTGLAGAVTAAHTDALADGAILATAGGGPFELPMSYLHSLPAEQVRPAITRYSMPSGRALHVVSDGECLNCADGEGNPIEVMDLSLSLQLLAVAEIARTGRSDRNEVRTLPEALEREVARVRLATAGVTVQPVTEEIQRAMNQW